MSAHVKGTIEYVNPLYLQSHIYTKASDVYSFGLVIIQVVRGEKDP